MSDVAADALVVKGEILVEYAKPYGLNRNPNVNLASLGITRNTLGVDFLAQLALVYTCRYSYSATGGFFFFFSL